MAVKIRLKRMGKIHTPFYRVVVMDSRAKRDGRAIEEIGKYHPTEEPSLIDIDSERALHWLRVGAQPTEQVAALLKVTGDWAKFTGEGDTAGTLRQREASPDKKSLYEAALAASDGAADSTAPTPRRKKAEEPTAVEPTAVEPTTEEPTAEEPTAETEEPTAVKPTAEEPTAETEEPTAVKPTAEEPTAEEPTAETEEPTAEAVEAPTDPEA